MSRKLLNLCIVLVLMLAALTPPARGVLAQESFPNIDANVTGDWLQIWGIGPDVLTARIEILRGEGPDLVCSGDYDDFSDNPWLDCPESGIRPGDLIYLYVDDVQIKDHIVLDLTLDVIDFGTGLIRGAAPGGSIVDAVVCNPDQDCFSIQGVTEGNGFWEIIFGPDTILSDAQVWATIWEEDGDSTQANLIPPPTIEVNHTTDGLSALGFTSDDQSARLEVLSPTSDLKCSDEFDLDGSWDISLDCQLQDADILPGDLVILEVDGQQVNELIIQPIFISEYNPVEGFIRGTAPETAYVQADICNDEEFCISGEAAKLGDGAWEMVFDPAPFNYVGWVAAHVIEPDGDHTIAEYIHPNIEAGVPSWVSAWGFGPDVFSARLEVYEADGSTLKCEGDFDPASEDVWLDCWDVGVFPGDIIYLFNNDESEPIKEHIVFDLTFDRADLDTGYFAGTGPDGSTVRVDVCPPEEDCFSQEYFLDGTTHWEIYFDMGSFDPASWFGAYMMDDDGDQTMVGLSPQPFIDYSFPYNWLGVSFFPPNSNVYVEIYSDPSLTDLISTETLFTDPMGFTGWDTLLYLAPGNFIRVSSGDGEIVKELILEELSLEFVDFELDQVGGYAAQDMEVFFVLEGEDIWFEHGLIADQDGWFIDLGADFGIDLTEEQYFWIYIPDEDGDLTRAEWAGPQAPPSINAYPQFELINGVGWPIGEVVTLVIDDDLNPDTGNLYFATGVPEPAPWEPLESFVSFDLRPFDLQAGHYIIIYNDEMAKLHQVTNLTLLNVDDEQDLAAGTGDPGSDVFVVVNWEPGTDNFVTVDGMGNWVADYTGQYDLVYGDLVTAFQVDEDGDATFTERLIVTPGGLVDEIQNMPDELVAPEIKNSLVKKVENAYSSYLKGNVTAAVNKLEALINEIDALIGNKISEELSHRLHILVYNLITKFEE